MQDFPPAVPAVLKPIDTPASFRPTDGTPDAVRRRAAGAAARAFERPDTRSPSRFVRWTLTQQTSALVVSGFFAVLEFLPGALGPYLVGRVIDQGIQPRDMSAVVHYSMILLGLTLIGVVAGVLRHTMVVRTWLVAMYGTIKMMTRKATQMGHVLPQRTPTGEVLSIASGDADQFGALTEVLPRSAGALMGYIVVAGIVLATSLELGIVVLVAAPVIVLIAMPLLRPLQRRQETERSRSAELTSLVTDIVAGLRILRGIGGERTFSRNYDEQSQRTREAGVAAGIWQAALDSSGVLFAGLFLVALTWLGSREVVGGTLSVGQLVSFFGYAVFMVYPIQTFYELVQKWVRTLVSAARAVVVLEQQPPWRAPDEPRTLDGGDLIDEESGLVACAGDLTLIVSAVPDDTAALADRIGRYLQQDSDPVSFDLGEGKKGRAARRARAERIAARDRLIARDLAIATRAWGVSLGGVDLADAVLADVREHILVSNASSVVFAGTFQEAVDPHHRLSRIAAERAVHSAAAEDVFEAIPGGWQGQLDERGRGLSGGQRQRLVLARALAADPPVLVLVEPTSAVDAHTEAMIAGRLAAHRAGRTTIVMSASPLLLHHAHRVAFMESGRITDSGTHEELLACNPAYRRVVVRSLDDPISEPEPAHV